MHKSLTRFHFSLLFVLHQKVNDCLQIAFHFLFLLVSELQNRNHTMEMLFNVVFYFLKDFAFDVLTDLFGFVPTLF
jgi:hypothetical protein